MLATKDMAGAILIDDGCSAFGEREMTDRKQEERQGTTVSFFSFICHVGADNDA